MSRRAICLSLILPVSIVGCATAPQVKYATDPRSGEKIEYSKASDGRTWLERNPVVGVPVEAAEFVGSVALYGTAIVGVFALCLVTHGMNSSGGPNFDFGDIKFDDFRLFGR